MKSLKFYFIFYLLFILTSCQAAEIKEEFPTENSAEKELYDPLKQPFRYTSIWNMPIGSNTVFVHINFK